MIIFSKIKLDEDNRMFRPFCIGKNEGDWFFRIDIWWVGFRWKYLKKTGYRYIKTP